MKVEEIKTMSVADATKALIDLAQETQDKALNMLVTAHRSQWVLYFENADICIGKNAIGTSVIHALVMDKETAHRQAPVYCNNNGEMPKPMRLTDALMQCIKRNGELIDVMMELSK